MGVSVGVSEVSMFKEYLTYKEIADMLSQDVRTIKRKIATMNIRKRRFGSNGNPLFLRLDIDAYLLFNMPFNQLNANQKREVKELIINAESINF